MANIDEIVKKVDELLKEVEELASAVEEVQSAILKDVAVLQYLIERARAHLRSGVSG
jgi:predicted nuclease with TOPRIM domain